MCIPTVYFQVQTVSQLWGGVSIRVNVVIVLRLSTGIDGIDDIFDLNS